MRYENDKMFILSIYSHLVLVWSGLLCDVMIIKVQADNKICYENTHHFSLSNSKPPNTIAASPCCKTEANQSNKAKQQADKTKYTL